MKNKILRKVTSCCLVFVMVFLMMPFAAFQAFAEPNYSVPTTGHKLLSSYNVFSGADISTSGAATALDIFNRNKLEELIQNYATYDDRYAQLGEEHRGSTMSSFVNSAGFSISQSVGVNVGIDKLFKVSAESKFKLSVDASYSEALETYFYEYAITVQKGYYNFNQAYLEEVRDFSNGYLTQAFMNALTGADGSTAEEFFNTYGTHIITSYTAGGSAGVYSSTMKTSSSLDVSIEAMYSQSAGASGTIEGIQVGGNAALELEANVKGESKNSECITNSGTYAYGGENAICFNDGKFEYASWVNSINPDNAVILLDDNLKMIPIWNLMPSVGNEARILELTSYFISMSEKQDSEFYRYFGIDESFIDYSKDWLNFDNCKIITNEEELNAIRYDLDGVYVLANDITLSKYSNWEAIGTKETPFVGRFYGNYNTISGINITENDNSYAGIFGCNDGLISAVKVEGMISSIATSTKNVGGIVAYNRGVVVDCYDGVIYSADYLSVLESNLEVEVFNLSNQYDSIVIGGEYKVYKIIGEEGVTYSNVNIIVEDSINDAPVYLVLENANFIGSSKSGTIYSSNSRPLVIISLGAGNSIFGAENSCALNTERASVTLVGSSPLVFTGGRGSDGERGLNGKNGSDGAKKNDGRPGTPGLAGENGSDGKEAVSAKSIYSQLCEVVFQGGNGGNGGRGGNGGNGGKGGADGWGDFAGAGDGGCGGTGGMGGTGGYGATGIAIGSTLYVLEGTVNVISGKGGNGGNGGDGGSGGAGGDGAGGDSGTVGYRGCGGSNGVPSDSSLLFTNVLGSAVVRFSHLGYGTVGSAGGGFGNAYDPATNIACYSLSTEYGVFEGLCAMSGAFHAYDITDEMIICKYYTKISYSKYTLLKTLKFGSDEMNVMALSETCVAEQIDNIVSRWENKFLKISAVNKTGYFDGEVFDKNTVCVEFYDKLISDYETKFDFTYKFIGLERIACVEISKDGYVRYIPVKITDVPENAPYIVVDSKNAVIGNTVTVKISLTNNPGITTMRVNVLYDSSLLKLTDVKYNSAMGGQCVSPENIDAINGALVLYWTDGFANYDEDCVFATLTFAVSENATADINTEISVTYDEEDVYDKNEKNVKFFCDNGTLTFIDYIPGDINGDGVVNSKDTTRLMRYLAGWDVEVNESALDVNGDGTVNAKDTTRLMRYLADWDVEIY